MTPTDLLQALRCQPFVPFRMHLSNGTVHEVRQPELVMVGLTSTIIGKPAPRRPHLAGSYEVVDLKHIICLVPEEPSA